MMTGKNGENEMMCGHVKCSFFAIDGVPEIFPRQQTSRSGVRQNAAFLSSICRAGTQRRDLAIARTSFAQTCGNGTTTCVPSFIGIIISSRPITVIYIRYCVAERRCVKSIDFLAFLRLSIVACQRVKWNDYFHTAAYSDLCVATCV